jgi:hypothetical protein
VLKSKIVTDETMVILYNLFLGVIPEPDEKEQGKPLCDKAVSCCIGGWCFILAVILIIIDLIIQFFF